MTMIIFPPLHPARLLHLCLIHPSLLSHHLLLLLLFPLLFPLLSRRVPLIICPSRLVSCESVLRCVVLLGLCVECVGCAMSRLLLTCCPCTLRSAFMLRAHTSL